MKISALIGTVALGAVAIAALGLAACDTDQASQDRVWYGLISNSCGPADGPAVTVVLDTAAYADCHASHPGQFQMQSNDVHVDSIPVGKILIYTEESGCQAAGTGCTGKTVIRLEVKAADSIQMQAGFRIETSGNGKAAAAQSGSVILLKCRERPLCG